MNNILNNNKELGLLCVAGEGAKKLLQGQLTCNLDEISTQSRLGAHCNPQGRIISLFRIFMQQDQYYLQMPRNLVSIALNALKKYAVFFKVTLTDVSDTFTYDVAEKISFSEWKAQQIAAGIPEIYPETSEKFLPHDINLQKIDALSFNKGCYTGQEIIARMQYKGKLKNHSYRAKTFSDTPPIIGADIFNQQDICGSIVDFAQTEYNTYELLILTSEAAANAAELFLDPARKNKIELLELPYSLAAEG